MCRKEPAGEAISRALRLVLHKLLYAYFANNDALRISGPEQHEEQMPVPTAEKRTKGVAWGEGVFNFRSAVERR
jgi:hypothetical protein